MQIYFGIVTLLCVFMHSVAHECCSLEKAMGLVYAGLCCQGHVTEQSGTRGNKEKRGGGGTRPWWLALLACGGAYWPLAYEPSAMTSRHPYYWCVLGGLCHLRGRGMRSSESIGLLAKCYGIHGV